MGDTLSTELYWLTLTALMTGLLWVPYIINRLTEQGIGRALWDPDGATGTQVPWAERAMRAHGNAVESLVVFAPLVLTVQITGMNNRLTAVACMVFFWARVAHFLVFTFGVPALRIPVFAVAVSAEIVIALRLLGAV